MTDDSFVPAEQTPTPTPVDRPADQPYADDELVYVDPETNAVVGRVEWSRAGNPKSLQIQRNQNGDEEKEVSRRGRFRKVYPWGTYRSMKNVFKVAGKQKRKDPNRTLDEVLPKALSEAFWND